MKKIATVVLIAALALALSGCVFGKRRVITIQKYGPGGQVEFQQVEADQIEIYANWDLDKLRQAAGLVKEVTNGR